MAQTLNILLLGKTGVGKSATGNTILGRKCFETGASTSSITENSRSEFTDFQGRSLRVVDGPGIGDTRLDNEDAAKRCISSIERAMTMTDAGFDAFLLVFRFGARFTQEERETIQFLKCVFGDDLLRKFGILVMTCGDSFERESEETNKTFQNWCQDQVGVFRDLYKECQNRAVIFNNVDKKSGKREIQVAELLKAIDSLAYSGNKYTSYEFNMNTLGRNRVIVQSMKSSILKQVTVEANEISKELQKIQEWKQNEGQVGHLEQLLSRAKGLVNSVRSQDKGTGVLADIVDMLMPTQSSVSEFLSVQRIMLRDRQLSEELEMEEINRAIAESEKRERRRKEEMERRSVEEAIRIEMEQERRRKEKREAKRREEETNKKLEADMKENERLRENLRRLQETEGQDAFSVESTVQTRYEEHTTEPNNECTIL